MIWLCGDTHGRNDLYKVEDYFESMKGYQKITKEDYLIILGDAGICWDNSFRDEEVLKLYQNLPCTVLWLDGNHENFDAINKYPVSEWHGGKVQFMKEDIIHLMRGQIYEIDGKTFFTFGGGFSIDKAWRIPYISWWPQEMPWEEEYEEGVNNLEQVEYKVDYVLTHTCPSHIARLLVPKVLPGEEELQLYFEKLAREVEFNKWYFGHWHVDWKDEKFQGLWEDIVELE